MSDLIERAREASTLKYQYHTIHVPTILIRMADEADDAAAELSRLTDEVERLRVDAGRYRWLRDVGNSTWQPLRDRYTPHAGLEHNAARAGLVDAAIDEAIKEAGNG